MQERQQFGVALRDGDVALFAREVYGRHLSLESWPRLKLEVFVRRAFSYMRTRALRGRVTRAQDILYTSETWAQLVEDVPGSIQGPTSAGSGSANSS